MAGVFTPATGADFHYRGTTDGGVPATGIFALGDWVETPTGILVCYVGGPAASALWSDMSLIPSTGISSLELAYAETTSFKQTTNVGIANGVDWPGLVIVVPATARPFVVLFDGLIGNDTSGDNAVIGLVEAAVGDGNHTPLRNSRAPVMGAAGALFPCAFSSRFAAFSGASRTFKIQIAATNAGLVTAYADGGMIASLTAVSR